MIKKYQVRYHQKVWFTGWLIILFSFFVVNSGVVATANELIITQEDDEKTIYEGSDSYWYYEISFATDPTGDTCVTMTPDSCLDLAHGAGVAKTWWYFTSSHINYGVVSYHAVDDHIANGVRTARIHHAIVSNDPEVDKLSVPDVVITIIDDDVAGVTLTQSEGSTKVSESGPTSDTYTVCLTSEPTANVTITIATDGETTVSPSTLTFTSSNWSTAQTVTVTAVDDSKNEGTHTSRITHTVSSTDTVYSGFAVADILAEVTDNDSRGNVIITENGIGTYVNEAGETTDTYSIVLDSAPTANVIISITPDSQTTVSPTTLTFTSSNWNTPQNVTVQAVDDSIAEGSHTSTLTHTASSSDSRFNGINISDLTVYVTDDDSIGITLTESDGATIVNELNTTSDSYTLRLNTQPTADVTITIVSDSQTTVNPVSLTFTPLNWDQAQTVTVTAIDDTIAEGPHISTIQHRVSSTDTNYSGISVRNVLVIVNDDDIAGVTITPSDGSTQVTEDGATDTYTVVLNTQPRADVTITITPDSQSTVDPCSITFTTSNWNIAQTITVAAVNDAYPEGRHHSTISHSASSTDTNYNKISIPQLVANVIDNDIAGVNITESGSSTQVNEQGPTSDSFTVVLANPPTDDVTITIKTDNQITVDRSSLTFTSDNWSDAQTVNVTAVDDSMAEETHVSTVQFASASIDSTYNGLAIPNLSVTVIDNDMAGITLTETDGNTIVNSEGTISDSYDIVLNVQPTANVTIIADPDLPLNIGAGLGGEVKIIFTPANWNIRQTITVKADTDLLKAAKIHHVIYSSDISYSQISLDDIYVTITDDNNGWPCFTYGWLSLVLIPFLACLLIENSIPSSVFCYSGTKISDDLIIYSNSNAASQTTSPPFDWKK